MSKRVFVKMRKLNNDGSVFLHEGEEVVKEFDPIQADRIMSIGTGKWQVIDDPRQAKAAPKVEELKAAEPEVEKEESNEEVPEKKKAGRPRKS